MFKSIDFRLIWLVFILLGFTSCNSKEVLKEIDVSCAEVALSASNAVTAKLKYTSGIRSILHDSKGNYWFGSHQEGVCRYDGKSFTYFTMQDGLSDNQVRTIQEDDIGVVWFGTGNGVSSYSGSNLLNHNSKSRIKLLEHKSKETWGISENDLWFGAGNDAGVYRFVGDEFSFLPFPIEAGDKSFVEYSTTGISRRANDNVWIATYAAAFNFDGTTFQVIDDKSLGFTEEFSKLHIRSIFEDSKGRLWIGNNGIGVLLVVDGVTTNFSQLHNLVAPFKSNNDRPSPPGALEHVFAISEDQYGDIWFGDRDTGAWKYDGDSVANYTIDEKLSSQHIWQIYEDKNRELLFAMGDGGVYSFDGISFSRKF